MVMQLACARIEKHILILYNASRGDGMKITIKESPDIYETEVVINCTKVDNSVNRIISAIQFTNAKLLGFKDGESFRVDLSEILYFESVNRKTFLYTEDEVYEIGKRLYELESNLAGLSFFRASKAMIINLYRVHSIRPEIGSRLVLTMDNGEKIVVSRQYAGSIKDALGV